MLLKFEVFFHGWEWELRTHDPAHRVLLTGKLPNNHIDAFKFYGAIRKAESAANEQEAIDILKEWVK